MPDLGRSTAAGLPGIGASAPTDPARAGIVHLGLGAFHRAHAAVHTARALAAEPGDWGIIGFANGSRAVADPMARQGGMYSVLELSESGTRADVVDVHRGFAVMTEDPGAVIREIADPQRRILTLTVSEGGYSVSARTGHLDVDAPLIAADLADPAHPTSVIGLIARGLTVRAGTGEPFAVLPCDNVAAAGRTARAMVAELLGVRDAAPVRTERFSMWVIEDDFPAGRPAWDLGGAIMSTEVEKYEQVKLRVLNGPHSLIAYLGALDGRRTIPASFDQDWIAGATMGLIRRDTLPTIDLPSGFDVEEYLSQLQHRWHNHELGHRTAQVGSDGSMRLPQRIPAPALFHLERGRMPYLLALTVAAWFACIVPPPGFDPGEQARAMTDPEQERLARIAGATTTPAGRARALLEHGVLSEALAERDDLIDVVGQLLTTIIEHGPRAAATEALDASTKENR